MALIHGFPGLTLETEWDGDPRLGLVKGPIQDGSKVSEPRPFPLPCIKAGRGVYNYDPL